MSQKATETYLGLMKQHRRPYHRWKCGVVCVQVILVIFVCGQNKNMVRGMQNRCERSPPISPLRPAGPVLASAGLLCCGLCGLLWPIAAEGRHSNGPTVTFVYKLVFCLSQAGSVAIQPRKNTSLPALRHSCRSSASITNLGLRPRWVKLTCVRHLVPRADKSSLFPSVG